MKPVYISAWEIYTHLYNLADYPEDSLVWMGADGSMIITDPSSWDIEDFDERVEYTEQGCVGEWLHED